jgi:hypothetical protein
MLTECYHLTDERAEELTCCGLSVNFVRAYCLYTPRERPDFQEWLNTGDLDEIALWILEHFATDTTVVCPSCRERVETRGLMIVADDDWVCPSCATAKDPG